MSDGRAISGFDRLPWLTDDAPSATGHGFRLSWPWVLAAILSIAAVSYWFGAHGWEAVVAPPATTAPPVQFSQTVALPEARPAEPEIAPSREFDVGPVTVPAMPRISGNVSPSSRSRAEPRGSNPPSSADATASKATALTPWPVRVTDGASGRLVRVGTFGSVHQAKKGWWAIVRVNPALKRLPALVVPVPSLRNSRTYYRLQMGTTSQAHSEVLCQRMRMIGQSCVVVAVNDRGDGSA